ncbi:catechol O-methyltransferase [Aspergillus japonicus CBS 114.51]|uniref:catechol O-methyltransferase n=2 Tax=Aspergillus TaxID=5052 RepID=A0A2V5GQP5_ASPV1|nr:catechol O-methyltransferase [Aspergillus japonicus CBS 114.51]PYI12971.1 catechol O-methyltransferase [Aspergillus violaceofuscus CBS 115571]RAH84932.1 catechol O-methyltransferase [Aspergillus japonicus CBS 114.51]
MSKPHAPSPLAYALDGREIDLLHYIYSHPDLPSLRNNPPAILAAIDTYSHTHNPLMNIGATKGAYIRDLIVAHRPQVMIELGGYVGYSAILFGAALRAAGGTRYLSLEQNPEMAAVANQLVDLAGLKDVVRVVVGSAAASLRELVADGEVRAVELVFLDHWQELYLPDLWLMEELGVLVPQTSVVIADNVVMPGAPQYLEWVRAGCAEKRGLLESRKREKGWEARGLRPRPGLVYQTVVREFETQFGRDGVAVTSVLGAEDV